MRTQDKVKHDEIEARRIMGLAQLDDGSVCYWKDADGVWWIYLPYCGAGRLSKHTVEEHEDGTVTVTPSILMTGHRNGEQTQRHGFLTKGVWHERY